MIVESGIYKIINIINDKFYIGSSKNLNRRKIDHFKLLRKNKHNNKKLQNSFNKYGEDNFIFEILLFCENSELEYYENKLICKFHPQYNIEKSSKRRVGDYVPTLETRLKLSLSHKGKPNGRSGLKLSQEQKDILKLVNMGNDNASKYFDVIVISPNSIRINGIKNLTGFCRDNSIKSVGTFRQFLLGNKRKYRNWKVDRSTL